MTLSPGALVSAPSVTMLVASLIVDAGDVVSFPAGWHEREEMMSPPNAPGLVVAVQRHEALYVYVLTIANVGWDLAQYWHEVSP